jgi:transcriptional regulator with XRE-family HTH domain
MTTKKDKVFQDIEFLNLLQANKLKTPNDFTIQMGQLIKKAREEKGISQTELAKNLNRRPATISDIENGKSEISVLTLVAFAIELNKTITYFFPESLLKNSIADIQSPFQNKMHELSQAIEEFGDRELTLEILDVLVDHYYTIYKSDMDSDNINLGKKQ